MNRRLFLQMGAAAPVLAVSAQAAEAGAVYLTDMSQCTPAAALARKPLHGHWHLIPYEAEGFAGTMLVAGRNTAAPEVALPVRRKGRYAIYLGVRSYGEGEEATRLLMRLKSDRTFSMLTHRETAPDRIDEYFWKNANLDEEDLVLRQFRLQTVPENAESAGNPCNGAWLAYVKLVPLSAAEAREESEERRGGRHRRLFAHHDAWSYTFSFRPATADDIRRELEPLRDTDFARIYWESGMGDRMYYPTKLGLTPVDDWFDDPYRTGDRLAAETWRIWRRDGIDPFRTALEYAHQIGLEFHATYRPAGFHFPFPEDEWNRGGFYDRHPELRGRDREGKATPRLSYAYPEVRQKVLEFLREMAQYPVDGICLAYNRRPPFVEYEAPVVDTFRQKYGQDPRKLDARDPRWLKHRAETLTTFMREVRAALADEAARQKRKPFELTAIVMSTEQENLYQAMDLAAWVQAGLVDTLVPYTSVPALKSTGQSWVDPKQAEFFVRLTRGSKTRLALNLMPRVQPPEQFRTRAHGLYQAGAEYLFFWDTNARDDFSPSWSALRRLGHREELAEWARRGSPEFPRPHRKLRKMADWDFRYDTPG